MVTKWTKTRHIVDPTLTPDIPCVACAGRDERPGNQRGCDRRALQVLRDGYNLVSAQLSASEAFDRIYCSLAQALDSSPLGCIWRPSRFRRSPLRVFAALSLQSSDIKRPLSKRWLTPDSPTTAQKHSSECRKNTGSRFSNGPSKI